MIIKVHLIHAHAYVRSWQISVIYVPHQKKSFAKYRWRTYNWWQITLIPVVSSNDMTYVNMVSIPAEEHNRYMTYIITYPSSGIRAFNAARTALHTLREHIHVLNKRPQDNPRSHALGVRSWPVAQQTRNLYRTIRTVLSKPRLERTGPGFTSPNERILIVLPFH
jgi:hypothetical protein